jgi:hypothetical protein
MPPGGALLTPCEEEKEGEGSFEKKAEAGEV